MFYYMLDKYFITVLTIFVFKVYIFKFIIDYISAQI